MTLAALVFCSVVVLALVEGFGAPAFRAVVAADAFSAAMPFLGLLIAARFFARRWPDRERSIVRVHTVAQAMVVGASFGWWWIEPHSALDSVTGGSLAAMGWTGLAGGIVGVAIALAAERAPGPDVLREVALGAFAFLLVGGGRTYRAWDHVEAGARAQAALAIVAGTLVVALVAYLLLRRREKLAGALPALAPAVACAVLLLAPAKGPAALATRDSVLLVVIDTLRADVADGAFRGDGDTMPQLRRLAERGTRFTQAISPAPWTLPATVSLLGGWSPQRHHFGASASPWEVLAGNPDALHLASSMRDAGYLTAGFFHNPYLRPWFGFDRGFYSMRPYHGRALDGVALALDWLHDRVGLASFTVLHLMDPHWPYDAPEGYGQPRKPCATCDSLLFTQYGNPDAFAREELAHRYEAEVAYTDAMLGRLVDTLEAAGALDRTWVIVTSDHGEELWDHGGFMHGHSLYDELLRVPLVVVPPKSMQDAKRGQRIDTQVRLEDVAATVLDIGGIDTAKAPDGRSLLPLLAGAADKDVRVSVGGYVKSVDDLRWSVRTPRWKAMVSQKMTGIGLFSLADDPGEQRNLAFLPSATPAQREQVQATLRDLFVEPRRLGLDVARKVATGGGAQPERDTKEQLRSLGYAQ